MKKQLALGLAAIIAVSAMTACGAAAQPAAGASQNTEAVAEAAGSEESAGAAEAAENAAPEAAENAAAADEDVVDLKLVLCTQGQDISGWDDIEAKINEITAEKIGVTIDVDWIEMGAWAQQMNLRLAAADEMDLIMTTPMTTFENMQASSQLYDITDLLEEYGQDILDIDKVYLPSTTVDGRIYAVPNNFVKGGNTVIEMSEDVLEELGLVEKADAMKSFSDLREILAEVKDKKGISPMYVAAHGVGISLPGTIDASSDDFADVRPLQGLGDPYGLLFADPETDEVFCYYLTDSFRKECERAYEFYQDGLMMADGASNEEASTILFNANVVFAHLNTEEPPVDREAKKNVFGHYFHSTQVATIPITRSKANMFGFAVPYTSSYPDKAVQLLNLLFTDSEVCNYLLWGLEGRDYDLVGDGKVVVKEDAKFHNMPFFVPNQFVAYDNNVGMDNYKEARQEAYDTQAYSKYLSFYADPEPMQNELTACYAAKMESLPALVCGSNADWEAAYDSFVKKLKDNGIEDAVAFYQEKLDEWKAEN